MRITESSILLLYGCIVSIVACVKYLHDLINFAATGVARIRTLESAGSVHNVCL